MYYPLFSSTYFLIFLVAVGLGLATQAFVKSTYRRYAGEPLDTGRSGAEVARAMLDREGLHDVAIEMVPGELTDHYDPRARVLRLSRDVYAGRSVAAAGIASHEAGHAVQHAAAFLPATVRQSLVPAANIGSQIAPFLILIGLGVRLSGLAMLGVILFGAAVAFQIVTLPVEFDASRRAIASLREWGMVSDSQVSGARSVLTAAALTYVAAALVSILYFVYYLGLARRR